MTILPNNAGLVFLERVVPYGLVRTNHFVAAG
jgi:hypothetical protein